jgi:hypothetical protein
MKRLRAGFAGLTKHSIIAAALLMSVCSFAASAQQVVGVSAILGSTNASQIDTYSATELDYSASYYYDAGVGGYLYQNGSLIRSGWAASGSESDIAYGYMTAPTSVGADYQLESDHYLMAAYMVWYEGQYYYSNPYGYSFSPAGGGSSSNSFAPGGGDSYLVTETIYLGTTAIGVATAPPYIGGIREWANGGTYGLRGTSGYIEVYGQHLLDAFDGGTTPAMSGNGVSVAVHYASAVQVNLSYTIDASASTGDRTLTLSTRFGTSNGATFTVADPTPQIISISPNTIETDSDQQVQIQGSGFGTSPSVQVSGGDITVTVLSASDTNINALFSVPENAPVYDRSVTVTSNGVNGLGFAPAGGSQQSSPSQSISLTAGPKLADLSQFTVREADQGSISVSVLGGTATSYQWSFTYQSDSANDPSVTFSAPSSSATYTDAHWYAHPLSGTDGQCTAEQNSVYALKVRVGFSNGKSKEKSTAMTVELPTVAAQVSASALRITGSPDKGIVNGVWRVIGRGGLTRAVPTQIEWALNPGSQFRSKIEAHENVHLAQYQPGRLFGGLMQVEEYYSRLTQPDVYAATSSALDARIVQIYNQYVLEAEAYLNANFNAAEREAHSVSDPLAPRFAYQGCGKYE